ncbi:hypothetical protein BDN70DRAFT_884060 [Pholiota conissans]|uniref:Uncharacterized protein n=1 Tax=Pholiota conissans TaxID=109636 RepID=A0A9P5YWG1_9AGAR|nr:hypothetical protein BDN70DRAFT_884060 [Pholiota conissans]
MFKPASSLKYRPTQTEKINSFLFELVDNSDAFMAHLKTLSVSIVMSRIYGYKDSFKIEEYELVAEKVQTRSADRRILVPFSSASSRSSVFSLLGSPVQT